MVKATHACFSDMVRITGFVVPRVEAVVNLDVEGVSRHHARLRFDHQVTIEAGDTVVIRLEERVEPPR